MTWSELLQDAQTRLLGGMPAETAADVRREARLLLSWTTKKSTAWLQAHGDEEAGAENASAFLHAADRRAAREPLAYITGWAGFYGHEFEVGPATLIPRPDTELLVEKVSRFLEARCGDVPKCSKTATCDEVPICSETPKCGDVPKCGDDLMRGESQPCRMLEVGTGSGCIPCSLAMEHSQLQVVAIDISPEALRIAARNAERLGVADRIDFRLADVLADAFMDDHSNKEILCKALLYDVIMSNPPYIPSADIPALMPEVALHEPMAALDGGPDGLLFYRRLLAISGRLLLPGGLLAVEIGYDQGEAVPDLFRKAGFVPQLCHDAGGHPRVVLGTRSV